MASDDGSGLLETQCGGGAAIHVFVTHCPPNHRIMITLWAVEGSGRTVLRSKVGSFSGLAIRLMPCGGTASWTTPTTLAENEQGEAFVASANAGAPAGEMSIASPTAATGVVGVQDPESAS